MYFSHTSYHTVPVNCIRSKLYSSILALVAARPSSSIRLFPSLFLSRMNSNDAIKAVKNMSKKFFTLIHMALSVCVYCNIHTQ